MFVVDKTLNYGRPLIRGFLTRVAPFSDVLDIGAGRGHDLLIAREIWPDARLHAVEAYPEYQAYLRETNIDVYGVDIEREALPFEDGSLDVVIANQILEHCKEVFWIFHNISRVLRVGGSLIIGVPNLASLHNRILLTLGRQPTVIKNTSAHVRGFTRHDVLSLLNSGFPGGYRLEAYGGSNFYPFPAWMAKPLASTFPSLAWGSFFLLKKDRPYQRGYLEYLETAELETNYFRGSP